MVWSTGRLQLPALSLTRTLSVWLPMPLIVADGVVWVGVSPSSFHSTVATPERSSFGLEVMTWRLLTGVDG